MYIYVCAHVHRWTDVCQLLCTRSNLRAVRLCSDVGKDTLAFAVMLRDCACVCVFLPHLRWDGVCKSWHSWCVLRGDGYANVPGVVGEETTVDIRMGQSSGLLASEEGSWLAEILRRLALSLRCSVSPSGFRHPSRDHASVLLTQE